MNYEALFNTPFCLSAGFNESGVFSSSLSIHCKLLVHYKGLSYVHIFEHNVTVGVMVRE